VDEGPEAVGGEVQGEKAGERRKVGDASKLVGVEVD
jgi:hypothetical protein